MSNDLYPHLLSEGYALRRPKFSTERSVSTSGKQTRIPDYQQSLSQWEIPYDFLGQGFNGNQDFATLEGFFEARLGDWDDFLWDDPTDDQVASQAIGTATSGQTIFQMVRTLGSGTTPVYAINGVAASLDILWKPTGLVQAPPINIYDNGSLVSSSAYALGTLPVTSITLNSGGTGGTNGTYSLSFTGGAGGSGAAGTYTISGNIVTSITLSSGGSGYMYPPIPVFPSGGIVGASAYCAIGNGGTLVFNSGRTVGHVITADFAYFYRVIFSESMLEFKNFATGFWSVSKVVLEQVFQ